MFYNDLINHLVQEKIIRKRTKFNTIQTKEATYSIEENQENDNEEFEGSKEFSELNLSDIKEIHSSVLSNCDTRFRNNFKLNKNLFIKDFLDEYSESFMNAKSNISKRELTLAEINSLRRILNDSNMCLSIYKNKVKEITHKGGYSRQHSEYEIIPEFKRPEAYMAIKEKLKKTYKKQQEKNLLRETYDDYEFEEKKVIKLNNKIKKLWNK